MTASTNPSLITLPLEVRREIYRYLLVPTGPIDQCIECLAFVASHAIHMERDISILLVSKRISQEALEILYGENYFKVDLNEDVDETFVTHLAPQNTLLIRRLLLTARPLRCDRGLLPTIDFRIRGRILANLSQLCIVAQEPLAGHYFNPPWEDVSDEAPVALTKRLSTWAKWLGPILQLISQHVSTDLVVHLDVGNREFTTNLIKKYIWNDIRRVQTRVGDVYFKRIEFGFNCLLLGCGCFAN